MNNKQLDQFSLLKRAVTHIRTQGKPSVTLGVCHYTLNRDNEIVHCAAWPFIVKYVPEMNREGSWLTMVDNFSENVDPLAIKYELYVTEIQQCHDEAAVFASEFMPAFEENVKALCVKYDLTYESL